ncbi:serine protease inhibitor 3-like [Schistocerca americana]|uniref:serine protease inhibitor 3-like n=1 Tax=Schistocerca americana TaxID=7009 RepID=UPI001F4FCD5C|nr:serine protease inhibitor 3-like [Schistocerca americana]
MAKLLAVYLLLLVAALFCEQALACTPGTRKYDGCNWCRCSSGGAWTCTLRYCPPSRACAEGERKYDGCNWCTCVRGVWVCTAKFCGRSAADGGGDAPLV